MKQKRVNKNINETYTKDTWLIELKKTRTKAIQNVWKDKLTREIKSNVNKLSIKMQLDKLTLRIFFFLWSRYVNQKRQKNQFYSSSNCYQQYFYCHKVMPVLAVFRFKKIIDLHCAIGSLCEYIYCVQTCKIGLIFILLASANHDFFHFSHSF